MPSRNSSKDPHKDNEQDLAAAIAATEASLAALKERYHQVQRDQKRQQQLKALLKDLKQEAKANHSEATIRAELEHIQQELVNIELNLESRLWNWKELREPFWQIVRFLGLGILIGWLLRSCSG